MNKSVRMQLRVLLGLIAYVIRIRPDAIFTTLLGVVSSALEVMGLAALLPLTRLAAHQSFSAASPWVRFPAMLGMLPDARFYHRNDASLPFVIRLFLFI